MKKLIYLFCFLLSSFYATAQTQVMRTTSTTTVVDSRLRALYNFYIPFGAAPTLNGGMDTVGGLFFKTLDSTLNVRVGNNINNSWLPMASKAYVDAHSGSSVQVASRIIPDSAYVDPANPTIEETTAYISRHYGSDSLGTYLHYPSTIKPIETREIVIDKPWYNAFPGLFINPVTGTLIVVYQQGKGHALFDGPVWIVSNDGGKTWSNPKALVLRKDFCDYKVGASAYRKSDQAFITTFENGAGNTIGLPLDTFHICYSFNDGITIDSLRTVGVTSWFHWMTTSTEKIYEFGAKQVMCVFGDTTLNGPLKGGLLISSDWYQTKTFVPWPNQSSLAAFNLNEAKLIPKGDTIFAYVRAESGGHNYYRTYSLDTCQTWSAMVPVNISSYKARPDVNLSPDGVWVWFSRVDADLYRGGIWSSLDGINFDFKGNMYPQNTAYMYSSSIPQGSTFLTVYGVENSQIVFGGNSSGIYVGTYPIAPTMVITKDTAGARMIRATNNPASVADNWLTFVGDSGTVRSEKPVQLGSDSLINDYYWVKGQVSGDFLGPTGVSIIPGVGDFTNSGLQSARSMAHNIAHKDSLIEPHHYLSATKAGYKIYAINAVGSDSTLIYDPIRNTRTYISLTNSDHEGAATVGDTVYTIPTNAALLEKIDSRTNSVSTHALPSAGWAGPNYANGSLFASKPSGDTHLLRHYVVGDSDLLIDLGFSFSGFPGPFDGRYQWFIGYFSTFWLKLDVNTNEVKIVSKDLTLDNLSGIKSRAVFTGKVIAANNLASNIILFFNPTNLATRIATLPAGNYPVIWTDDVSVYAGGGTGPLCKIDPSTMEFWVVAPSGGYGAGVTFGTRNILLPNGAGKIYSFETIEKGSDPIASTAGYLKLPVDSLIVGDTSNHVTIKMINTAGATSYANPNGSGNRTSTLTVTTDLTLGGTGDPQRLVNGDLTTHDTWWPAINVPGHWITFDFGAPRIITEAKYYQELTSAQGTWQWQGSNNNSTWANIGASFSFGGATVQTITALSANTTAYRYYRMLGVLGPLNNAPYIFQFEFKISVGGTLPAYTDIQGTSNIHVQDSGFHFLIPTELTTDSSHNAASTAFVKQLVTGGGLWTVSSTDIYNANSGSVGIGMGSPTAKLHVDGSGAYIAKFDNAGNHRVWIKNDGTLDVTHFAGNSTTPTVAVGPNITGTVSVTGTDVAGEVTLIITSPSGLATDDQLFTLTFNSAYATSPYVVFSPSSATAIATMTTTYVKSASTTNFVLGEANSGTYAATTYKWTYHVTQ